MLKQLSMWPNAPLSSQCQSPPCFLNPSNQALENAIQFLCSLDILPPISRTLPLYSKMNSEKRVSSPFLPTYNNEIPFSELSGWYPLPDQFMNIGLDIVSATLPLPCLNCIQSAQTVLLWRHSALSIFFVQNIKALSFHLKGLTFFEQIYQVSEKKILACWA